MCINDSTCRTDQLCGSDGSASVSSGNWSRYEKILPLSAVGGAALLLFADTMGRILGSPGELESGIVTALIGAPVFILIIRKAKVKSL